MNDIDISRIDLNLLVVFGALMEERHAGRTAQRLNLTQSAISHALGRLRRLFNDPLLVRGQGGLVPTPKALALAIPVAEILAGARALFEPRQGFDPSSSRRSFVIGMPDYAAFILLSPLLRRLRESAPFVTLLVRTSSRDRAYELMQRGTVDAVIGNLPEAPPGYPTESLFTDEILCAMGSGHPALEARWDMAAYLGCEHMNVSLRGEPRGYVDAVLAEQGLSRRVTVTLESFLTAPQLAATTDLVATEPRRVLAPLAAQLGLHLVPAPFAIPPFTISLSRHPRTVGDQGWAWLGNEIAQICSALDG